MIRLISYLIFGHVHDFEIINETPVIDESGHEGIRYIQRCRFCGKIKKDTII